MAHLKNWAEEDKPREKLLLKGTEALSTSELLAILINNGTKEKNVVEVAKELLAATNNDVQKLCSLSVNEMVKLKIKGIGKAKATLIAAALELGVRRSLVTSQKRSIATSADIADYLQAQLQYKSQEVFVVIFLNTANKILHHEAISVGGYAGTVADPRIIIKRALEHNATSVILCHNHPSGSLRPSRQDEALTRKIKEAASYFDIKVLDHIIVSNEGFYSFADKGNL